MDHRRHFIAGLILLATIGGCQREPGELSAADKAAVQATIDKYAQAAVAADWDAWGRTLASDVTYSPPNVAPIKGRDAAVAWAKAFPKVVSLTPSVDEISGRSDIAFVRGSYTLVVTLPDGKPMTEKGAFLEIHQRQPDGSWPYTHLMYHSTDPLPAAPAPARK